MSTRERSNERRISSASAAARTAPPAAARPRRRPRRPAARAARPRPPAATARVASLVSDRSVALRSVAGRPARLLRTASSTCASSSTSTCPRREEAPQADVLGAVEEHDLGGLAVAARAPDLLVVGVERLGDLGVEDPAHVGLVDAHPERGGGHDDVELAVHEALLHVVALGGLMPAWYEAARSPPEHSSSASSSASRRVDT